MKTLFIAFVVLGLALAGCASKEEVAPAADSSLAPQEATVPAPVTEPAVTAPVEEPAQAVPEKKEPKKSKKSKKAQKKAKPAPEQPQ